MRGAELVQVTFKVSPEIYLGNYNTIGFRIVDNQPVPIMSKPVYDGLTPSEREAFNTIATTLYDASKKMTIEELADKLSGLL